MLKIALGGKNGSMVIIGITPDNVTQLMAGRPLLVDAGDLGVPGFRVALFGADSDTALVDIAEQHGLLGPERAAEVRAALNLMEEVPATRGDVIRFVQDNR